MYNQFLGIMNNEKSAKETYLKAVLGNITKVKQIKTKLETEGADKYILMINLLSIYSEVLYKLQESLAKEVSYMEANFINKLASSLKDNKSIINNLNASIDLMQNYGRQLSNISEYKRNMFGSYFNYEQTVLMEDAITRVVHTYSDEVYKKNNDSSKINFANKEYEYTSAVTRFNEEAPGLLRENVCIQ